MPRSTKLFTAGYSGHTPESFVRKLQEAGVEKVIDVRQNPFSRKPGFSRKALAAHLAAGGVDYEHLPQLGVPPALRDLFRDGAFDREDYLEAFRVHLRGEKEAFAPLLAAMTDKRCCLVCLEKAPAECHRSVVAAELCRRRKGVTVVHL